MMETLRLKQRPPVEDDIENWDDEDFNIDSDDLTFPSRSVSSATNRPSRRDSYSSHMSFRSDRESLHGEEERHVHIPGDDEKSTLDAIAAAARAGIPIPNNVPTSALLGGTIKRLGTRQAKKVSLEDWEHDIELPDSGQGLQIKQQDQNHFPDVLRQVSGPMQLGPTRALRSPPTIVPQAQKKLAVRVNLDRFKDTEEDEDFFGDETIKVTKTRRPISVITPPTPNVDQPGGGCCFDDDFENDFELPSSGELNLAARRDAPKTPTSQHEDFDWGEGSLGTRYGGTRRGGRSNRSSSASALSPSVSSTITFESEDEAFDELVLPNGPLDFKERLNRRRLSMSPERDGPVMVSKPSTPAEQGKEDFLDDLDLGEGEIFDSNKLTNHRNIKIKEARPASPARPKAAVSLTFTNKPITQTSRLPRPSHERTTSSLEPVFESGGSILQRSRRSQRLAVHSSHSSLSNIPSPSAQSAGQIMPPNTPRRRELGSKTSANSLRNEPTTTNAQLLRLKRSLPAMRAQNSSAKLANSRFDRPPSRSDRTQPQPFGRPKTPVDRRPGMDLSGAGTRRHPPPPFLPAGSSQPQSQHTSSKARMLRRQGSEHSIELRPGSRTVSRTTTRSPSPRRPRTAGGDDFWARLSRPKNPKQFGDGHELDKFDDLPTSMQVESRFIKPAVNAPPKPLLRKVSQRIPPTTPSPGPYTPGRSDSLPRFARDTAVSRIARETALTSLAQRAPQTPLGPLSTHRGSQLSTRSNSGHGHSNSQSTIRARRRPGDSPKKPSLISNLNMSKGPKTVNGMSYNPLTYKWEGNENALHAFDAPASSPLAAPATPLIREKEVTGTPRPALITNRSAVKGIQVVGGMVFDPQAMCWLKIGPSPNPKPDDIMASFDALEEDDDVFKDIPDLEDKPSESADGAPSRVSDIKDEWLVGEEFDVGPEFVRRQREEEDRWRKRCEKWVLRGDRDRESWRWTIRELVTQFGQLPL